MPAGRNTKGQNGQDHEPNVPWGWMHENFRVLRWPGRSFFLTSPFIPHSQFKIVEATFC